MQDKTTMKSLRSLLMAAACAMAGLPAWGAIELQDSVTYLQGAQPSDKECAWEANMVSATLASARGAIVRGDKPAMPADTRLSLAVVSLGLIHKTSKSDYLVVIRANIVRNGKLLASRDFQGNESYKNERPSCPALLEISTSFGQNVSDWATKTSLMPCGDDCVGIHPDEVIVTGAEIPATGPESLNDTVRDECAWPTAMVKRLVAAFNENDEPPPRAKLEARAIDIGKYPGRRLLLRVKEVHAVGGGGLSGPKWMSLTGELYDGKTLVASFDSYTSSGRGLTTCRSVDSLSDSTAEMIVNWLRSPSMGAQLR